jgi:hypothetical protein
MKQISSAITTSPKEQPLRTGTQHGERGLATPESSQVGTASKPSPTPNATSQLSPQQIEENRARICFEVRVVLSAYFQPHESDEVKAAQMAWWADELEDWYPEQVVWALRKWNTDHPRLRPTVGDIVKILKEARANKFAKQYAEQRKQIEQAPEQPRERVSAEKAAEILKQAGF